MLKVPIALTRAYNSLNVTDIHLVLSTDNLVTTELYLLPERCAKCEV